MCPGVSILNRFVSSPWVKFFFFPPLFCLTVFVRKSVQCWWFNRGLKKITCLWDSSPWRVVCVATRAEIGFFFLKKRTPSRNGLGTWQPSRMTQSVSQTSEEMAAHVLLLKMTQMFSWATFIFISMYIEVIINVAGGSSSVKYVTHQRMNYNGYITAVLSQHMFTSFLWGDLEVLYCQSLGQEYEQILIHVPGWSHFMLPVCVKRSRLYCSTIIFCNLIFKSASKLQLCLSSCLYGAWNACILWLKRDCRGQSHVIRQVVPPTLSIIKAIPPSSGTWYKVFTADRSFVWVTMLTYEEVFDKALDFLCMENNSNVGFFLWLPGVMRWSVEKK